MTSTLDANAPATTAATQQEASAVFQQTLQAYGFDAADTAALTQCATDQITGAGQPSGLPVPESQVALNLMQTPQFAARFPGIIAQQKAGTPVMSPGDYVSYEQQAYQTAHAAGLPAGFLTPQVIGNLVANQVDPQELSDRITQGYQAVAETTPETRQYMQDAFGVGPGGLAAYFLNPDIATPLLMQQATAAQIGGAGMVSGFNPLPAALTLKAAQLGVSASQGEQDLTGETALQLALTRGTLEQKTGPGTITQTQLAGGKLLGDEADLEATRLAGETRVGGLAGGGGYGTTQRGVAAGTTGQVGAANEGKG